MLTSTLVRTALRSRTVVAASVRPFTASTRRLDTPSTSDSKPNSQGHAVQKAQETLFTGKDVQSASVRSGQHQATQGRDDSEAEPFDTAAEDKAGQAKFSQAKEDFGKAAKSENISAQSGSFKDHRAGAQTSDQPNTPGEGMGNKEEAAAPSFKATAKSFLGLNTTKKEHQESKSGPRQSQQPFSTSARAGRPVEQDGAKADGEGSRKIHDDKVQGDQNAHLQHKNAGEADKHRSGNAAAEPSLPSKARGFHTSARSSAPVEKGSEGQQVEKAETGKVGGYQSTHSEVKEADDVLKSKKSDSAATSSARAHHDEITDTKSQKAARGYHTSARVLAQNPAKATYVNATKPEAAKAGLDMPGEAYPSSASSYEKLPKADPSLTPSSELPFSSSSQGPPNEALRKQAVEGTLPARNRQPEGKDGEMGHAGTDAYKVRDAELKGKK